MGLELAKAYIRIEADQSELKSDLGSVKKTVGSALGSIGRGLTSVTGLLGIGAGIGGLVAIASDSVGEAQRAEESYARLAAVLRATGGAAGYTAEQLSAYASELEAATTTSDDEIMESMAVLGTFKSVAGDVFKRATAAALDLSAVGFGSTESAATMLGKALEDPIRGLTALRRVGVSFNAEQEKQIKHLVATNQLAKAQAQILAVVEGQVKGTAAALADTDSGKLKQLENTLGNIKEELGAAVMPLFIKFKEVQIVVMKSLVDVVKWMQVVAENSGTVWSLIKTQMMASLSGTWDFLKNFFFAIPEMSLAAVKGMWEAFKGFFELMASSLKNLLTLFKVTFQAISDFWLDVFTGEDISESFSEAMSTVGQEIKRGMQDQMKAFGEVGSRIKGVMAKEMEGVDLFAMSDTTKQLQQERDKLAGMLAEARSAMDAKATTSPEQLAATPAAAATRQPVQVEIGRVGFAEFGRKLQESMLKDGDKNEKAMISLLEVGNKIQTEQLKVLKDSSTNANAGLVEGHS